ncbi:MAG: OPT family oligopeptide transporter [Deltaproteobacteria bacterium]|nr:MAG: OPT family oligopeptide transporter [Deltaproteobacteria bacterium]
MAEISAVADHKPYVADETRMAEFTPKAVIVGAMFGLIFGASTVYLALKAGLTVSASIPIAVLSISLLKKLGGSTILENNIVQTIGSAGESIAAGVVFTLPGFLFLAIDPQTRTSVGAPYFSYWTIFTLALLGGMLGVLMMVPLRRALIVKEHGNLPYPEGAACAQVLIAGEQGGAMARIAYLGLAFSGVYAALQLIFGVIAATPGYVTRATSRIFPAATVNAAITPEYMGVGYIIGPRIAGVLVAGGVIGWLGIIPLIASLVPQDTIAQQLVKLGYLADIARPGVYGWDPATHTFAVLNQAIYRAYVRQIGAGAVAAGGFITLLKTLPTIIAAFRGSVASLRGGAGTESTARTSRDLPIGIVLVGSLALALIIAFLPFLPGTFGGRVLLAVLIVVFGFFFVTVSSRIVGLIGTSSNPVSGMTIATLLATCLLFVGMGWTDNVYQPMALCVGGMVAIAAANAGATSQDLKTGYLVGATPRLQQIGLMIGAVAAALVIGFTIQVLDKPSIDATTGAMIHQIGSEQFPAPQGTLMATLIRGLLAHNLDWQFVLVGVFLAITVELCGVSPLSFAVGAYLPLSTTLPIFIGGAIKGIVDRRGSPEARAAAAAHGGEDVGPGSLFATGLVAGGTLTGTIVAFLHWPDEPGKASWLDPVEFSGRLAGALGNGGYQILGVICFVIMGIVLYRVARRPLIL